MGARIARHITLLEAIMLAEAGLAAGAVPSGRAFRTGFTPLDGSLDGGLRAGELTLLGGAQAVGKTTFALQVARNLLVEEPDVHVLYACYEHPAELLLERLLALECGLYAGLDGMTARDIRQRLGEQAPGGPSLRDRFRGDESVAHALTVMDRYGDRLHLLSAYRGRTGVAELGQALGGLGDAPVVLVVDYLQKVFVSGNIESEDERVTRIAEGLKDLALERGAAVLAVTATDGGGVGPGRTRLRHFRGSTALLYEADVALVLNNKWDIVARHQLVYGAVDADTYRDYVVVTVEKNRNGVANVDLEFRAVFAQARWDPDGRHVRERLLDERVYTE